MLIVRLVSTKLAERPQGGRLFDLLRSGDTLVVRWVDRLGRNYQDICDTIRESDGDLRAGVCGMPPRTRCSALSIQIWHTSEAAASRSGQR